MTFQFFGRPDIVRIEKRNDSAAGVRYTGIACTGYPIIPLMKDTGALIRQALAYFDTIILAAIIDDQQLEVGKTLSQDRLHCRSNETFRVVYGHNDTDGRLPALGHIYASFGFDRSQISKKFSPGSQEW